MNTPPPIPGSDRTLPAGVHPLSCLDILGLANSLVLKNPMLYALLLTSYTLAGLVLLPLTSGSPGLGRIVSHIAWVFFIGPALLAISRVIVCNEPSRPSGFGSLLLDASRCWWPNIRATFLLSILMLGLETAYFILQLILNGLMPLGRADDSVNVAGQVLVRLSLSGLALYVIFRLSLGFASLADGLGGARDAFKRSVALTCGRVMRLIPLYLILLAINIAGLLLTYACSRSPDIGMLELAGLILGFLLTIYGLLLAAVSIALVYVSLRGVESASSLAALPDNNA